MPGLLAMAAIDRHLGELITRDWNRVMRFLRRNVTPRVFPEDRSSGHHVVATFLTGHSGRGGMLVVALARGSRVGVAPRSTQQDDVLPSCQRKDDREKSGSEHVMLIAVNGKKDANQHTAIDLKTSRFAALFHARRSQTCVISHQSGEILARAPT